MKTATQRKTLAVTSADVSDSVEDQQRDLLNCPALPDRGFQLLTDAILAAARSVLLGDMSAGPVVDSVDAETVSPGLWRT